MSIPESHYPARWWRVLPDGRIECDLCPRFCKMHEGQRGLCFVRKMEGGKMVLTTYGRSSGFCVDPIEKKPLNHFYPGSSVFSFGTAGCNLACKFCQNWDISKSRETDTMVDQAMPDEIAKAAEKSGCKSVAFTYNDPVIFAEYAMDVADACHARGIKTVAVTAGYITEEPRREFYSKMDAANVDLKAFTDDFYVKLTGGHLQPVLDTLVYLKRETNVWFEITTLLIPGNNDSDAELSAMSQWILRELGPEVPLHFSAFHPDWKMTDVPPTPASTLTRARDIALKAGLHYVYTGNVHDTTGGTTFCPSCHEALIVRDWYRTRWPLPALRHRHRRPFRRVQPSFRQPPYSGCDAPRGSGMSTSTLAHIPAGPVTLEGMLEIPGSAAGLVLFAHGSGSSRLSPRNNFVAGVLRAAGVGTLLMDLLTPAEDRDYDRRFDIALLTQRLLDAARWVVSQPATRELQLGFFGASTGAAAALEAAAMLGADAKAVVSRGGRPDLASPEALGTVTAPTLLLVGGLDDVVIDLNQQAYAQLRCEKELVIIPGATHLFEEPGTLEEVARQAAGWFAAHFPASSPRR